jgi:hypothetical protein
MTASRISQQNAPKGKLALRDLNMRRSAIGSGGKQIG